MAFPRFPPLEVVPVNSFYSVPVTPFSKNHLQYQNSREPLSRGSNTHGWQNSHVKPICGQLNVAFLGDEFFCDVCHRGFKYEAQLAEHIGTHRKQHNTGFTKQTMHVTDTEELENWKRERRKNYPSAKNVAKRQAQQKEMMKRGELLKTEEFHKFKARAGSKRHFSGTFKRTPRVFKNRDRPQTKVPFRGRPRKHTEKQHDDKVNGHLKERPENNLLNKFGGAQPENERKTLDVVHRDVAHPITDSECEASLSYSSSEEKALDKVTSKSVDIHANSTLVQEPSSVPNVLKNLMESYQSDTEVEDEKQSVPLPSSLNDPPPPTIPQKTSNLKRKCTEKYHKKQRTTLLQRLLAKEIRHERNVILQCVRFIVQEEFFDDKSNNV